MQHYDGGTDDPKDWYRNTRAGYGYGTYENPVHTVINTRPLVVTAVTRGPSDRWPTMFGQEGYIVDKIALEVPDNVPLDLYDLVVQYVPALTADYAAWAPPDHGDCRSDVQPHALQVVKEYRTDVKVIHITDTHVYGEEVENGWFSGLNYKSMELREPRPGTPDRQSPAFGFDAFPFDKDLDGKTNEGAIYLQEELQAINLINPDFVVFSGDAVFGLHNFSTYPNEDDMGGGCATGHVGSEYRFEFPWWYDELLALNVPVYCVVGNHDGCDWGQRVGMGGTEGVLPNDDGLEIFQDLFGPTYYSWDYGDDHFVVANSMDWPEVDPNPTPSDNDLSKVLHFLFGNKFPEAGYDFKDRQGFLVDLRKVCWPWSLLPLSIVAPHKDNGNIGRRQLDWISADLSSNHGKSLRAVFSHHGPFGSEWGEELVDLMRRDRVAFEGWGDSHSDRIVRGYPWYDGGGEVIGVNTTSSEIGVDAFAFEGQVARTSDEYAGYRMLTLSGGRLVSWGFQGADADPDSKWSIPGWAGVEVGPAAPVNDPWKYRGSRPILQWMEQDNGFTTPLYPGEPVRAKVATADDGTFDRPLPLNEKGPFDDVTTRVKNALDKPGAVQDFDDCRIELPMRLRTDHSYYAVENGRVLEQYDTDGAQRMVVVSADAPAGKTTPVRVHRAGKDTRRPVVDTLGINGGAGTTADLRVSLSLSAHDNGAGMLDYRVSNTSRDGNLDGAAWRPYTGPATISWVLAGPAGRHGYRYVHVQFRDASMPGNVVTRRASIAYK